MTNQNCIFCKIIQKQIPAKIAEEVDNVLAFADINPQAPYHFIIVPKQHLKSIFEINDNNQNVIFEIFSIVKKLAKKYELDSKGFRVVNNFGEHGGQSVDHLHFHLLGGRQMQWPPG